MFLPSLSGGWTWLTGVQWPSSLNSLVCTEWQGDCAAEHGKVDDINTMCIQDFLKLCRQPRLCHVGQILEPTDLVVPTGSLMLHWIPDSQCCFKNVPGLQHSQVDKKSGWYSDRSSNRCNRASGVTKQRTWETRSTKSLLIQNFGWWSSQWCLKFFDFETFPLRSTSFHFVTSCSASCLVLRCIFGVPGRTFHLGISKECLFKVVWKLLSFEPVFWILFKLVRLRISSLLNLLGLTCMSTFNCLQHALHRVKQTCSLRLFQTLSDSFKPFLKSTSSATSLVVETEIPATSCSWKRLDFTYFYQWNAAL